MNGVTPQISLAGWIGVLLFAVGLGVAIYITLTDPESPVAKLYHRYVRHLDGELRTLFIQDTTGATIANGQLGLIALALVVQPIAALIPDSPDTSLAWAAIPIVIIAPKLWFIDQKNKRQEKIEAQLDTFLLALANSLKASPSLGDAFNACTTLMRSPIKEELELTMKEYELGVALDAAILNMGGRVGSRAFAGALTTVLIGRQTGGDLPKILETASASLREMARLEGVVRTKTAEGKAQAWVLGAMPPFLVALLNWMDPEWLKPLSTTYIGYVIVTIAVSFWVAAIFAARKILAVDI
ncbi:MAG: type II secretion system F family protein [Polyangiales bacterium]